MGQTMLEELNEKGFLFREYSPRLLMNGNIYDNFKMIIKYFIDINEPLHIDEQVLKVGEGIGMHYHIIPGSFQAVTWIPEGEFEGREFIYGTKDNLKSIKPKLGLMCFMKPNDPNFIHGVSRLKTDTVIRSIGASSSFKDLSDTINDIYV